MFASIYDAHNNNKIRNNDRRVIGIAQLSLSAVLKMNTNQIRNIPDYKIHCIITQN